MIVDKSSKDKQILVTKNWQNNRWLVVWFQIYIPLSRQILVTILFYILVCIWFQIYIPRVVKGADPAQPRGLKHVKGLKWAGPLRPSQPSPTR
jgi:hypothetical protein